MAIKYYVRKSWKDTATQQGAYNVLSNAVAVCDKDTDYRVYDADGNLVYNPWYYVRPNASDTANQSGAYRVYSNATADAEKRGYNVYDYLGVVRYPLPYKVQLSAATAYYTAADGAVKAGTASKGVYTIVATASPYGQLKSGAGWIDLRGLDIYEAPTPLELVVENLEDVYSACIGCKHVSGGYGWPEAMEKKKVNCSIPVTRLAVLAGIIADGKRISHTSAIGTNATAKKNTIAKAMSGYGNLDLTKCKAVWVGKKYAKLPDEYKKAGVFYVQDSNIAVSGGDGFIYACHNWAAQMTEGKGTYVTVKLDSGYTKNSDILVAIIPND